MLRSMPPRCWPWPTRRKQPALRVLALMREAVVLMRLGQGKRGAAGGPARRWPWRRTGRDRPLLARSLLCESEAQLRGAQTESAVATAQQAAALFDAAGDLVGLGRAHWVIAVRANAPVAQRGLARGGATRRRAGARSAETTTAWPTR